MAVAAESLCMGCMELKSAGACPNPDSCGWREETEGRLYAQLPPRTVLENRYVIGRVLGQGGFGITYLAVDLKEFRKLALKEYFPSSFAARDTDRRTVTYAGPGNREPYQYGLRKFEEEARTLQNFQSHPNIVTVIKSFTANGTSYIVMEYLDGVTLLNHVRRQPSGTIPFQDAFRILVPIMDALREVHHAGITHRDVSPDNIYLCRTGRIKLLDFGAARLALRDQTHSQQLILKPGYTPEEQYHSSGLTGPYTDIYSLAATMYRCITGGVPPEAPERLSDDQLVPPRRLANLPAHADKALMKALAVHPRDRYQTIEDFQRDLSPPNESRAPRSAREIVASFSLWWSIATALLCSGSLLRTNALFWAGLIPLVVSLVRLAELRRTDAGRRTRLWVPFYVIVGAGVSVTAVNPFGAALLLLNLLICRQIIADHKLPERDPPRPKISLRFVNGEFAGSVLELSADPVVIGRVPDVANVVIPLPEISAAHARVCADASLRGAWIEDLKSRNGTFIRRSDPSSIWVRIAGREFLGSGDRFCLSAEELATFEIVRDEPLRDPGTP